MQNAALLAGRILLALLFILAGFHKIGSYAGTQLYMQSFGVPGLLLPLVILLELGGGILIVLGALTRPVAVAMAGFSLLAALIFHHNLGAQQDFINFFKDFAIAGGFLVLAVQGAGHWSLDDRLGKTREPGGG